MSPLEKALVSECFRLDENVLVAPADEKNKLNEWQHGAPDSGAGPVYVLQSAENFEDWWDRFEKLQVAFRVSAQQLWRDKEGLLRDPNSQASLNKFFISITEEEFLCGLLWLSEMDQREKTLVFRRTLADLASHAGDKVGKPGLFIDVTKAGAEDAEAQKLLQERLLTVPKHVETISYDSIQWGPGIDHSDPQHAAYERKFLDDFAGECPGGCPKTGSRQ